MTQAQSTGQRRGLFLRLAVTAIVLGLWFWTQSLLGALIDALGLFLLARWLFGGTVRPFLGLFLLMALRQVMQAICALPPPPNMIWHYPGFPSFLVTYHVANDFFFSGHTAIAVFGAIELSRLRRTWLTVLAILIACFEVATVLILRAHYTMDVFTGVVAALWIAHLAERISPRLDRLLRRQGPATTSVILLSSCARKGRLCPLAGVFRCSCLNYSCSG